MSSCQLLTPQIIVDNCDQTHRRSIFAHVHRPSQCCLVSRISCVLFGSIKSRDISAVIFHYDVMTYMDTISAVREEGKSTGPPWFLSQRASNVNILSISQDKLLNKQLRCRWFMTLMWCPIIQVPHCIRVFFYFVWFVFINPFSILLWIMYLL